MIAAATLIQNTVGSIAALPPSALLRDAAILAVLAWLIVLFKPLLSGIARALMLVIKPRLSKEQMAARSTMRDAQMLQRMINASSGPSSAAELRALAARA